MTNCEKDFINIKTFFFILMACSIFFGFFLLPKIGLASTSKAIIGPLTVMGDIPIPERQILFNRFREQINLGYQIVSHKVLELIDEQGLTSIDIEDCNSSKCVRKVLNFTKNIKKQFDADDLFILQLVQSKSETQLSLKLSSLSIPEVTRNIVTESCQKCDLEKLKIKVDILVQKTFSIIGLEVARKEELDNFSESKITSKKTVPLRKNFENEKNIPLEQELIEEKKEHLSKPEENLEVSEENLEVSEEEITKKQTLDPYILDRDLYNQEIGKFLIDVTYALQIFRSGMFVQIEVSIDPSGTVVDQKIINSSGSEDFDETAIMTLQDIQFDPLPETMLKYGNYVVNLQIHNSR